MTAIADALGMIVVALWKVQDKLIWRALFTNQTTTLATMVPAVEQAPRPRANEAAVESAVGVPSDNIFRHFLL